MNRILSFPDPRGLAMLVLFTIAVSATPAEAQKTFYINYNNVQYSYTGSYTNDPASTYYNQWTASHPGSGLFVAAPGDGHYNCHAFAWPNDKTVWVMTYGGANEAPQIYYNTTHVYVQTLNESEAEIAVYGNPANPVHSAVRITNSSNGFGSAALNSYPQYAGWYISKWDGGPLVVHRLTDCPYLVPGQSPTFYKKAADAAAANHISGSHYTITGSKAVCYSGTQFTLSCGTPQSFTVTWSSSSNITLPANHTVYPLTATANGNGVGWIAATLNFPDGTTAAVAQYAVWVGVPAGITSISTSQWSPGPGTSSTITVSPSNATFYGWPFNNGDLFAPSGGFIDTHGASSYTWSCSPGGGPAITFYQNSATTGTRYVNGGFSPAGRYAVMTLQASNACGSTQYPQSIYVQGYSFAMSPNPAGNEVTVSMTDNALDKAAVSSANGVSSAGGGVTGRAPVASVAVTARAATTYTIRVIDAAGTVRYSTRKTGSRFSIPVTSLKNGNYTVEISDGKTLTSQPLIVAH